MDSQSANRFSISNDKTKNLGERGCFLKNTHTTSIVDAAVVAGRKDAADICDFWMPLEMSNE